MKANIKRLLLCGGCIVALSGGSVEANDDDPLVRMFEWWNQAFKTPGAFTQEGFERYFTEGAVLIVNGEKSAEGIPDLTEHFRNIQANSEAVHIILPFVESFTSGDRIFTYHFVYRRRDGQEQCMRTMGYAVTRDEKIALINFVRIPYDPQTSFDRGCAVADR